MFTKADKCFEDMAADPARRRAAIADLTTRRTLVGVCSMIISVYGMIVAFSGKSAGGIFFAGAVSFAICFKLESDLRLLRVIDKLEQKFNEKPAA